MARCSTVSATQVALVQKWSTLHVPTRRLLHSELSGHANHWSIDMLPRFQTFAHAFRASRQWTQNGQVGPRLRIAAFICQSCQRNFSSKSPLLVLRKITQASRRTLSTAAKNVKDKSEYPSYIDTSQDNELMKCRVC